MIQSLCNEKERDLAACIRKVNHLAAQMTDLNRMKQQQQQQQAGLPGLANNGGPTSDPLPASQLDQIRRELQVGKREGKKEVEGEDKGGRGGRKKIFLCLIFQRQQRPNVVLVEVLTILHARTVKLS